MTRSYTAHILDFPVEACNATCHDAYFIVILDLQSSNISSRESRLLAVRTSGRGKASTVITRIRAHILTSTSMLSTVTKYVWVGRLGFMTFQIWGRNAFILIRTRSVTGFRKRAGMYCTKVPFQLQIFPGGIGNVKKAGIGSSVVLYRYGELCIRLWHFRDLSVFPPWVVKYR